MSMLSLSLRYYADTALVVAIAMALVIIAPAVPTSRCCRCSRRRAAGPWRSARLPPSSWPACGPPSTFTQAWAKSPTRKYLATARAVAERDRRVSRCSIRECRTRPGRWCTVQLCVTSRRPGDPRRPVHPDDLRAADARRVRRPVRPAWRRCARSSRDRSTAAVTATGACRRPTSRSRPPRSPRLAEPADDHAPAWKGVQVTPVGPELGCRFQEDSEHRFLGSGGGDELRPAARRRGRAPASTAVVGFVDARTYPSASGGGDPAGRAEAAPCTHGTDITRPAHRIGGRWACSRSCTCPSPADPSARPSSATWPPAPRCRRAPSSGPSVAAGRTPRADRRRPAAQPRRLLRAALPRLRRRPRRLGVGPGPPPAARRRSSSAT